MGYQKMFAAWLMGLVATAPAFAQPAAPAGQGVVSGALDLENNDAYGEELLRGPVHEAFAEQYNQDPIDGVVIDRAPPAQVNEIPPEIRPDGDNVDWLSGYWFWDDHRSDFLWVSGTWRVIPPGHRWLPGYWAQSADQYQWVSGSWVSAEREAIEYIAQSPPESLDLGPVGVAPSQNHFWIPGCWNRSQNDYAWRPGYWSAGHANWVWVPQRYLSTPRGYVFCNGYWDYPIARRGTLFAPFYFSQPVYARSGFSYSPRVSILASLLQSHFWVRPQYHHYYFGDFYAPNYRNVGIIPWHSYHRGVGFQSQRYSFDPLFVHASLYNRSGGGNFYQQINNQYNVFVNQVDRRPSLTYRDQQRGDRDRGQVGFNDDRFDHGPGSRDRNESLLGESIRDLVQRDPNRFTRLTSEQMSRVRNESKDIPSLISLRRENETSTRGRDNNARDRQSFGLDRQSPERGSEDRSGQQRGDSGRDADRSETRGLDSMADRLQLPPVERDRSIRDRQTAQSSNRSQVEERHSSGRPQIDRPTEDRSTADRPIIGRPGSDRPGVDQPNAERPSADRPGFGRPNVARPGRETGSDSPLGGSRISDQIRDRNPLGNRPSSDSGAGETGNVQPRPTQNSPIQPGRTLPGIGTVPTRPQIGAPSSQPLRTPGFGERSSGLLGSQMLSPNESGRPSLNRGESGDRGERRDSGRPSLLPNSQRPSAPSTVLPRNESSSQSGRPSPSVTPSPTLRAPFSGGSRPSLRSGAPAPSSRPQFTPRSDARPQAVPQTDRSQGRPQLTPRTGGGSRPEAGPSLRGGNRGGGDGNRGPGIGSRGKRD